MVWKWDIGGRGIKNNASVCLQLKLPSTKAGTTSGGEGRFFGGVEGIRERGGGTRS